MNNEYQSLIKISLSTINNLSSYEKIKNIIKTKYV